MKLDLTLPEAWRRALPPFVLALVALCALYFATASAMVQIWNRSETFAHAYVVPLISIWLIWRKRLDLSYLTPRPALIFLVPIALIALAWLLADLAAVQAATQFAFVGMLVLLVPALLGTAVAARLAFPLGFLFFAVPFGEFLLPWLMSNTADFTVIALRATGLPVYREGLQFVIPTGSWSVVQACSGIRYLMASLMVGTLYAYLNYRTARKRWIFVGVSLVVPLMANWGRAYMIVMLAHLSGNKLAMGVDHFIYGWVFFGIIILALYLVGARWADPDEPPPVAPPPSTTPAPTGKPWLALAALLAVLVVAPAGRELTGLGVARAVPALQAPALAGWQWHTEPVVGWKPDFEKPAASLNGTYENSQHQALGLYVAYYRAQDYDSKLISSVNQLVNGEVTRDWSIVGSHRGDVALAGGQTLPVNVAELREQALGIVSTVAPDAARLRVLQLYWINGRPMVSDWQAKLYGAVLRLAGQGDDAAVIVVYARKSEVGSDDELLRSFLATHWGALDTWMRGVRAQRSAPSQ